MSIALNNTDVIEGGASVDAVVDYTISGIVGTTITRLASGVLGTTLTTALYTAGAAVGVSSIVLVNTHSAAVNVTLRLDPADGAVPRYLIPETISLGVGYSLHTNGAKFAVFDASGGLISAANVSDAAYAAGWNGVTTIAPSKNAVYDEMELQFKSLLTAQGDIGYASAANTLARLAKGAANTKLFINAGVTAPEWATGLKTGSFSIDTATASGTQAITGVGFKPALLIFIATVINTTEYSIGFADNGGDFVVMLKNNTTWARDGANCIYMYQAVGVYYDGNINSWDADGFTINWVKTGAKTGTLDGYYLAFR